MTPVKVLLSIISLYLVLGLMALAYPEDGIHVGDTTLRYPKLSQVFEKAETTTDSAGNKVKVEQVDPEDAIRQMMEETKAKQFAAYSDSLKYYEDFFREGRTRFDLPNNDLTWFDRFFTSLQNAQKDSSVVHVIHYGDSQLEEDRISSTIREDLQTEFGGNGPGMLPAVMHIPSQSTSQWNNGDLQRYIIFGPKEEHATHNRYGPLAQVGELNGSAVIGVKKREGRKDMFPHVGGYSTIKVLSSNKGSLKLRLTYEHEVTEQVGTNADGSPKLKIKNKKETAAAPAVEKFTKLNVYTWKLPDTTSNIKLYIQRSLSPAHVSSINVNTEDHKAEVYLKPEEVSLAIGRGGLNIKLASMLTGFTIDVFREIGEDEAEEDIYLDEFSDEIDQWVIDSIKRIGLDTAKAVLNADREMLVEKADLEEDTVDDVLRILRAEFE